MSNRNREAVVGETYFTRWRQAKWICLRAIGVGYCLWSVHHVATLISLGEEFTSLTLVEQTWLLFRLVADSVVFVSLWTRMQWAELLFNAVAVAELAICLAWANVLGNHYGLVLFHLVSLGTYFLISLQIDVKTNVPGAPSKLPSR